MSERFYIHCGDDINKQLMDTESDFNIHVEEIGSDEELIRLCNLLNKQQATVNRLEEENKQLRTQLLLCQQSKDGRFQVGEVPPITVGRTISFSTNGDD